MADAREYDPSAPVPRDPIERIEVAWYDPETLTPNPANYRTHPEGGTPATAESLGRFGWVKIPVYNRRTGRLVDGHDRREIVIRRGEPAMPVRVVDLSEEDERDLILVLDRTTGEAGIDRDKLADLLGTFDGDGALGDLVAGLAAEANLVELLRDPAPAVPPADANPLGDEQPIEAVPPDEFPAFDENLPTTHRCPKCDYRWNGKPD